MTRPILIGLFLLVIMGGVSIRYLPAYAVCDAHSAMPWVWCR